MNAQGVFVDACLFSGQSACAPTDIGMGFDAQLSMWRVTSLLDKLPAAVRPGTADTAALAAKLRGNESIGPSLRAVLTCLLHGPRMVQIVLQAP